MTSTKRDTNFYGETDIGENHKFVFLLFFNSLHIFAGVNLLEAPTHKIWKLLLAYVYHLIEEPTPKMCKKKIIVGYNLIEEPISIMSKLQPN